MRERGEERWEGGGEGREVRGRELRKRGIT